jgi:3-methyladenine DNA glycosylase AlkD
MGTLGGLLTRSAPAPSPAGRSGAHGRRGGDKAPLLSRRRHNGSVPAAVGPRDLPTILRAELSRACDPKKAAAMQAYMKSAMPYFGIQAPELRAICERLFKSNPIDTASLWRNTCLQIWREAQFREERYAAIELTGVGSYRSFQTLETVAMYEEMIVTGAWWDFVDQIASKRLGALLISYPVRMRKQMLQWSRSPDLWKRRASILCQLGFKGETDLVLLYACIETSLSSKEFFLQKAIGWALRQYAWSDPREVARYVRERGNELSALSKREALKNIG